MGLFSKDIKTMDDLFLHTLQDIYYAENQIVKALPKMIDKATNRNLAAGLRNHLRETEGHVSRLEQVFAKLGQTPKGVDCPAIDGIIKEADEVAGEVDDKKVLDAAIIGSAQAVEHYEISRYGTLIAWAEELGHGNVVQPAQCQSQAGESRRQDVERPCRRRRQPARIRAGRAQGAGAPRGCLERHGEAKERPRQAAPRRQEEDGAALIAQAGARIARAPALALRRRGNEDAQRAGA